MLTPMLNNQYPLQQSPLLMLMSNQTSSGTIAIVHQLKKYFES